MTALRRKVKLIGLGRTIRRWYRYGYASTMVWMHTLGFGNGRTIMNIAMDWYGMLEDAVITGYGYRSMIETQRIGWAGYEWENPYMEGDKINTKMSNINQFRQGLAEKSGVHQDNHTCYKVDMGNDGVLYFRFSDYTMYVGMGVMKWESIPFV